MLFVFHNAFGEFFKFVAEVNVHSLDKAYELTNNVTKPWIDNSGVYPVYSNKKGYRSTSVGDFIYNPKEDKLYVVARFGFDFVNDNLELVKCKLIKNGELAFFEIPATLLYEKARRVAKNAGRFDGEVSVG